MEDRLDPLHGSCNCGRNNYTILIPDDAPQHAKVFFDDDSENRTLLTTYLRIPLSWYRSYTTSFFPDETHTTIKRIFTPQHEPNCKRTFCGVCGTHLSYWSEQPSEDADYLNVTVGSLRSQDARRLGYLGLVPEEDDVNEVDVGDKEDGESASQRNGSAQTSVRRGTSGGLAWFEEMIDGSRLGRTTKTRRGVGMSPNGSTIEWEIAEYRDGESEPTSTTGKRKLGDVSDVDMK